MCGIAGYLADGSTDAAERWATACATSLRHRGPDDNGVFRFPNGQFVHQRLAIIDLSPCGHQPMSTADQSLTLAYNGEIVNYREVRQILEQDHGVQFRGSSDTEVLLQSWATWGENCLTRLIGMFAFAMLDFKANKLLLVRDPAGIKPLYTVSTELGFAFASEITPLLEWPGVTRRADPQNVVDYLRFGYTDHLERTMFADVAQVQPGTVLEIDLHDTSQRDRRVFWSPQTLPTYAQSRAQAVSELRDMLWQSVAQHLRADVPIASCLSGGIDSSSIVMLMREIGGTKAEIHTFSHLAPGTEFDEKPWVDMVVQASGAISHTVESTPEDLSADLESVIKRQEQPFISTSVFAQFRLMRAIADAGIKVTLDGQGADELFGGYAFHVGARLGTLVRQGKYSAAWKLLRHTGAPREHLQTMLDYCLRGQARTWARTIIGKSLEPSWMSVDYMDRHDVHPHPYRTAASSELLREAMVRSLKGPGLPHLLRYEDRNSMAHSVESRVPFITRPLMEFALSLPEELLISETGETKTLLREAMRGIVPDPVLDRRDKIAFQTPEADWMAALGPTIQRVLTGDVARHVAPLKCDAAHETSLDGAPPSSVWRWLNLVEWTRLFNVSYT